MMARLTFVAVGLFALSCRGAEQRVLARTLSPDKQSVIIEEQNDEGRRCYYFARASDHEKLGDVLPADQQGQLSNVAIVASWSARSSKVALLVFYGTKRSELLLFTREASRQFQAVSWQPPDAEAIYRQRTGRRRPRPGDGYDENAVGPWQGENTVSLVSGQGTQREDHDHYLHLLVTCKATVRGHHAVVSALHLEGPFSDQANERFTQRWGDRYFEATDK